MGLDFNDALPFLRENHMAVVTTVSVSGRTQSTVVSAGPVDGRIAFVSRENTAKVRNATRGSRCTVTCIRLEDHRYITVEGPTMVHSFSNTAEKEVLDLMALVYEAAGRPTSAWDDFELAMKREQRSVITVTPEHVYGSLERRS